jgi:hypothetical protein
MNIQFQDELIEGSSKSPELELIRPVDLPGHGRLVKVRESFLREMAVTALAVEK